MNTGGDCGALSANSTRLASAEAERRPPKGAEQSAIIGWLAQHQRPHGSLIGTGADMQEGGTL